MQGDNRFVSLKAKRQGMRDKQDQQPQPDSIGNIDEGNVDLVFSTTTQ